MLRGGKPNQQKTQPYLHLHTAVTATVTKEKEKLFSPLSKDFSHKPEDCGLPKNSPHISFSNPLVWPDHNGSNQPDESQFT